MGYSYNRLISGDNEDVLASITDAILPFGGGVLVLVNANFDESIGEVNGRELLCVGGFMIPDENTRRLARLWRRNILKKHRVPYFRTSACCHGNNPFDGVSLDGRINAQKTAIKYIKDFTMFGIAVTVDLEDFDELAPKHPLIGSAYSLCAHTIIGGLQHAMEKANFGGDVAYFFEAGHRHQAEANRIMSYVFMVPELRKQARYAGHSFVPKERSPSIQTADLLAYHWYKDRKNAVEGRPRRKDCASLLEHQHLTLHIDRDMLGMLQTVPEPPEKAEQFLGRLYLGDSPRSE